MPRENFETILTDPTATAASKVFQLVGAYGAGVVTRAGDLAPSLAWSDAMVRALADVRREAYAELLALGCLKGTCQHAAPRACLHAIQSSLRSAVERPEATVANEAREPGDAPNDIQTEGL